MVMWSADDLLILIEDRLTDHPVVTATLVTPAGRLMVMAEITMADRWLVLRAAHLQGDGIGANDLGFVRLRWLAQAVMEVMDADGVLVEGAARTSGANPGHRPRALRFTRNLSPATGQ